MRSSVLSESREPLRTTSASAPVTQEASVPIRIRLTVRSIAALAAIAFITLSSRVTAQSTPHVVLVRMIDKPNGQFGFDPAAVSAQPGDTIRFVQVSSAPHNVHFTKTPKGAKLGTATSGSYVMAANQSYEVILDARFPAGTYQFICDPHQTVGMAGTLTIATPAK
jgi:plastocyanin